MVNCGVASLTASIPANTIKELYLLVGDNHRAVKAFVGKEYTAF